MTTKKLINTPTLKHHGFSLIEIIITLSLLSILMANATPYFGQILDKNRNKAQGVQLHLSLSLARTYAITNSVDVVVCPAVTMPVSYTHLRAHETPEPSRMPSSA